MAPPTIPAIARFGEKYRVEKSGCWIWTAGFMPNGYPQFRHVKGKNGYGHRFAYEHFVGPLEKGQHLHHACKNKACVNPAHLQLTTPPEHPGIHNADKTHCKRGHPLSADNLYPNKQGRRVCRTCREQWYDESRDALRTYHREYMRKRRAEDPAFAEK